MKPIGLVQRCLFSFGRQLPAPDPTLDPFWKEAFIPFLEHIFRFVLPSVGPKACEAEWKSLQITNVQEQVGFEVEELLKVLGVPRTVCNLAKGVRLYVLNAIAFFKVRSSCCFQ